MGDRFGTLMQVAALVALLLYLLASLRAFPQRGGRWLQGAAILALGLAILLAIVETIRWFAGGR